MQLSKRSLIAPTVTIAVFTGLGVAAPAYASDRASLSDYCTDVAKQLVNKSGTRFDTGNASFACLGSNVVVTTRSSEAGRENRYEARVEFSDKANLQESISESSSNGVRIMTMQVPTASTEATASLCVSGEYDREVRDERTDFIWGCLRYGEYDQDTGEKIWERGIQYEWTMWPGWSSAQNKLRTIPSIGSPVFAGNFASYKQNGIAPPSRLSASAFTNNGNATTSGWVVGNLDTDGQFSVWMEDVSVTDTAMGFDEFFEGSIASHRFTCNSEARRCYYPSGEEAPLQSRR